MPCTGSDRWHAYEVSWLDARGKPRGATLTFSVPASTPRLVESKSLKLYLNSFNGTRFGDADEVRMRIAADLSLAAGGEVIVAEGLPPIAANARGGSMPDDFLPATLAIDIDHYRPPHPGSTAERLKGKSVSARVDTAR